MSLLGWKLLFYYIMVIEGSSSLQSRDCCVCCLWTELFLGVLKAVVEILGKRRNEMEQLFRIHAGLTRTALILRGKIIS